MPWAYYFQEMEKVRCLTCTPNGGDRHHAYWFKKWFKKTQAEDTKKNDYAMKPFTIYHLCRESFSSLQQPLVDIIVKAAKPDMIFLLGASLHRRRSESIFNESAPISQHISDCFFLVLIQDLSNKELHEWQDKIENNCKSVMPVTTIDLQSTTFEEWLKAGHKFAGLYGNQHHLSMIPGTFPGQFLRTFPTRLLSRTAKGNTGKD